MKIDRSNTFDLCYYGQVNSLRLKSSVASRGMWKHLTNEKTNEKMTRINCNFIGIFSENRIPCRLSVENERFKVSVVNYI